MGKKGWEVAYLPQRAYHPRKSPNQKKMGVVEIVPGVTPTLSLQPLSQVCVARFTVPDIIRAHNGTKVGRPLSEIC
jgi:hypothetical protein